jgi:GntR family transcriptional regulator/MocR family aminotransferase
MGVHVSLVGRKDLSGEIYRQLRRAIVDGRFRPGDALPPTRELARRLSVARTTVTVAYDRLAGEGFVTSRVGAGTFVSLQAARAPEARSRAPGVLRARAVWDAIPLTTAFDRPARFDFRTGVPDATLFPYQRWRRLAARELRADATGAGVYAHPAGSPALRDAIARHIAISRGVEASADDICITNGTQQAVDVIARVLLAPGDRVVVEDPGYPPPRRLFESLGARVLGVPVDRDGILVDALPRSARLIYVTPSHQWPLGGSMSLSRRLALMAWAERNDAAIIEDDYDSEFRFQGRPIEPLQTLDTSGRVIYVGSFSKTLSPTLRLGFVVTPPSLRAAVHRAKYLTDWHSPTLMQEVLARFIEEGEFGRHLRKIGQVYRERHEMITTSLTRDFADHLELLPSAAGLHVAAVARRASAHQIGGVARRAWDAGVAVQELSAFAMHAPGVPGLLLGYGAIPTGRIEDGLRRLRECFRD